MADRREYVTSLVIEADASQIAKAREELARLGDDLARIGGQARVSPWGGGGGGGGGPGDGDGGGWRGFNGAAGAAGGIAARAAVPDEAAVISAAESAANLVTLGFGGMAVAGVMRGILQKVESAVEVDAARAKTRGMLRGMSGGGAAAAGVNMGFGPAETESIMQALAAAGLSGRDTGSMVGRGMAFERMGIGAGGLASFLSMFATGGGARFGGDAAEMQRTLGVTFQAAVEAGLQNADIPKYLARVADMTSAMAEKGVDVRPDRLVALAAGIAAGTADGAGRGTRALGLVGNMLGAGQQVAAGGGDPLVQYDVLRAAGMGQAGVGLAEAMERAESGEFDMAGIIDRYRKMPDRDGAAMVFASKYGISLRFARRLLNGDTGTIDVAAMAKKGARSISSFGGAGVSKTMQRMAEMQKIDADMGEQFLDPVMRIRVWLREVQSQVMGQVSDWLGLDPEKRADTEAMDMTQDVFDQLPPEEQQKVLERRRRQRNFDLFDPNPTNPAGGDPSLPSPVDPGMPSGDGTGGAGGGGGAYLEIRPSPGLEQLFNFRWVPGATG